MGKVRVLRVAISVAFFVFLSSFLFQVNQADAVATVPTVMNFQGRLTDTAGNIKANGTYNMKFRIYTASTGGTLLWSEDRLVASSQGVTVTNGLFSVQLGSVTPLPASVFNAANTYFEIELPTPATATTSSPSWTEGAMSRSQIATSAYAYNAETLDGIDSAAFAQLGSANAFTGTNSISVASANAFQVKNGSTNLFNIDTSTSQIAIGTSDTTGVAFVLDTKTSAGDPGITTDGAMYYNSSSGKFRCYEGGWKDCITNLQGAYDNSTSPATITTSAAGKGIALAAGVVPTTDLFNITNAGKPVTTAGVNGLSVNYVGGAAAVESSGMRVDFTPGSTSGGTWSGMRIVANATGPASGVNAYGIKLEGPTAQGAGIEEGMYIGTGWDIGADIQSGGIQLATQSDPSAPAAGNLRIYAKDIAGRVMPKWIGPSGVDTPFQASLGFNRVSMAIPNGTANCSTGFTLLGLALTGGGTCTAPAPATTNLKTSIRRTAYSTGTTAGTSTYQRASTPQVWRGNAAGLGGFFFTTRFGLSTTQTNNRVFVGMNDIVANPTTNIDYSTSTASNKIGMVINTNTGNWSFMNNTAGTAPTVTSLGATIPVNTTDLMELVMFSAPNGSSIGYRVTDITTGAQVSGSVNTNLPANNVFLSPFYYANNNATAAAVILEHGGWYLESDN